MPKTYSSRPFAIVIGALPPSDIWSNENVPGSYNGTSRQWTPGRGSDGRVTQTSWNLLPVDEWVEVLDTRADQKLETLVQANAIANYGTPFSDMGNGDWDGCFRWSGMAIDGVTNTPRAWFHGGGHYDSANNGLYRFDFNRMAWGVEMYPRHQSLYDPSYNITQTTCSIYPPALALENANINNPDSNYYSDSFDPEAPTIPTARHTYGSLVYHHERNEIAMLCRRMWTFDLASKTWRVYYQRRDLPTNSGIGENMFVWWDQFRSRYIINATQNDNQGRNFEYDPVAQRCYTTNVARSAGNYYNYLAQCRHGDIIYGYMRPDGIRQAELAIYNIATNIEVKVPTGGISSDTSSFYNGQHQYYGGGALAYSPERGKLLLSTPSNANARAMRLYWVDPVTGDLQYATEPGWFPSADQEPETRMQYVPQLKAMVYLDVATKNIRLMRLA